MAFFPVCLSLVLLEVIGFSSPSSLVKGMATHSSILSWRIPWTEEPGGLQSGVTESDMIEATLHTLSMHASTSLYF